MMAPRPSQIGRSRPSSPNASVRTQNRKGRKGAIDAAPDLTQVELLWIRQRVENRIRFGRIVERHVIDHQWRVVSFEAGSIFAFVRWTGNQYGTTLSRIDILRAVALGERYVTVPHVRPGGESLLRISG